MRQGLTIWALLGLQLFADGAIFIPGLREFFGAVTDVGKAGGPGNNTVFAITAALWPAVLAVVT